MRRYPKGQGLIELLIALAVIATSIVGTVGLLLATLSVAQASKLQIIGSNLAREGIEIVRNQRDSNWLGVDSGAFDPNNLTQPLTWNSGLYAGDGLSAPWDYTTTAKFLLLGTGDQAEQGQWKLLFAVNPSDQTAVNFGDDATTVYLDDATKLYTQWEDATSLPTTSYHPSGFYRLLTLHPICRQSFALTDASQEKIVPGNGIDCLDRTVINTQSGDSYTQVGIEVRSEVHWTNRGGVRNNTIVEKMYDWKP